jgi:3-deoxy-D-arabino-heptulosonate 7-phosphate (DAHP) synthase
VEIGRVREVIVMAGPCSVESREQIFWLRNKSQTQAPAFCTAARSSHDHRRIRFKGWGRWTENSP